jgi:uncharacterized repeat protein (TIGR04076 family)
LLHAPGRNNTLERCNEESMSIQIEVFNITGTCPVFKKGDIIFLTGPQIDLKKSDAICIHALPSLLHFALALREGVDPVKLGLSKEPGVAYVQCPDPGKPLTPGGTVTFKIIKVG